MKLTLLELTQNILGSMDSDEVNSISDTAESRQVAQVVRTAYYNIMARAKLPELMQLFNLTASGDADSPVLMIRPDNVAHIEWVKYNKSSDSVDEFQYVTVLPLQQFLDMIHSFRNDEDNIETMTLNGKTFYCRNDRAPTYCTVVDDVYIVFDAYDVTEESTLQSSKTLCYGEVIPSFEISDTFTPTLDEQQFPLLLNEAKSLAFLEMKQIPNEKVEKEARRQWQSMQKNKRLSRLSDFDCLVNFGRR